MIIQAANLISDDAEARYSWAGLARFQNIPFVEERLSQLHELNRSQRQNARKQARQIRYSLIQAKEYFDAARSVTLATKPNLLYYSIMSLALAEILYKQTGDSSLDRVRAEHRHHGLELKVADVRHGCDAAPAMRALRAVPLIRADGTRFGTFELWHRSCREMPICGDVTTNHPEHRGASHAFRAILMADDQRLPLVPAGGLSLLDCLQALPGMMDFLRSYNMLTNLVRGRCEIENWDNPARGTLKVIIHPGDQTLVDQFFDNFIVKPAAVDRIDVRIMPAGGGIVIFNVDSTNSDFGIVYVPNGSMWRRGEIRFWPSPQPLNEFGFMYFALYITGNYARYFPDRWLLDVEEDSPLALAVEELLSLVERRMPALTLSELRV